MKLDEFFLQRPYFVESNKLILNNEGDRSVIFWEMLILMG